MLIGGRRAVIPGIVGDGDHVFRALFDESSHQVRVNDLKTDGDPEPAMWSAHDGMFISGNIVTDAVCQLVYE